MGSSHCYSPAALTFKTFSTAGLLWFEYKMSPKDYVLKTWLPTEGL